MRAALRCLIPLLLLAGAGRSRSETPVLELIPENAPAGFGIRNLDDLQKKGDKLIKDSGWQAPARPSELFTAAYNFLGIKDGVDTKGSAALILANPKEAGNENPWDNGSVIQLIVVAVPFTDADKMAANFGIAKGDSQTGHAGPRQGDQFRPVLLSPRPARFPGRLRQGGPECREGQIGGQHADGGPAALFADSDMLLHVGTEAWGKLWQDFLQDLEKNLPDLKEGIDPEAIRQLRDGLSALRFVQTGLRLRDEGVLLQAVAVFDPKKSAAAAKLLSALRPGRALPI